MNSAPSWVTQLVKTAVRTVHPQSVMGPMGWRWSEPESADTPWEVSVFPTPCEVYAGPLDGSRISSSYIWGLYEIMQVFDHVPGLCWITPAKREDEFVGPEVNMFGMIAEHPVRLRLFNTPPTDEEPTVMVDPANNRAWKAGEMSCKKRKKK